MTSDSDDPAIKRIERAIAAIDHTPPVDWQQRIRLACELTARNVSDDAEAVKCGETLLTTAMQLCTDDPIATNEALTWAVVLHAATQGDSAATVDAWLEAAIQLIESKKIAPVGMPSAPLTAHQKSELFHAIKDLELGTHGRRYYDRTVRDVLYALLQPDEEGTR